MEDDYTEDQIRNILEKLSIEIISETDTNFLALCPFHSNKNTPSFSISKEKGVFLCFSPSCDERGNILQLIRKINGGTIFSAKRLIEQYKSTHINIKKRIESILDSKVSLPSFPDDVMNKMINDFDNSLGHEYMIKRGFDDRTLKYFNVGYSKNTNMVTIPVHDWTGKTLVGVVGRSIDIKKFKNSKNLPTGKVLFNAHRARTYSDSVIIVESSMDAMRLYQAGFPNVVATLGGFFTNWHRDIIDRYFNKIIIMTDMDNPSDHIQKDCKKCKNSCLGHNPGRALAEKIVNSLSSKIIRWASYDYQIIYPHDAKDPGDMSLDEVKQCIKNSVSSTEYEFWKKEIPQLLNI